MASERDSGAGQRMAPGSIRRTYRASSGRPVSQAERVAAAQTRVAADQKRGVVTPDWIVELASESPSASVA